MFVMNVFDLTIKCMNVCYECWDVVVFVMNVFELNVECMYVVVFVMNVFQLNVECLYVGLFACCGVCYGCF